MKGSLYLTLATFLSDRFFASVALCLRKSINQSIGLVALSLLLVATARAGVCGLQGGGSVPGGGFVTTARTLDYHPEVYSTPFGDFPFVGAGNLVVFSGSFPNVLASQSFFVNQPRVYESNGYKAYAENTYKCIPMAMGIIGSTLVSVEMPIDENPGTNGFTFYLTYNDGSGEKIVFSRLGFYSRWVPEWRLAGTPCCVNTDSNLVLGIYFGVSASDVTPRGPIQANQPMVVGSNEDLEMQIYYVGGLPDNASGLSGNPIANLVTEDFQVIPVTARVYPTGAILFFGLQMISIRVPNAYRNLGVVRLGANVGGVNFNYFQNSWCPKIRLGI